MNEKLNKMIEWTQSRTVIKLTTEKFVNYVKSKPRNYSVIVMLTALAPDRGCQVCHDAKNEFNILANSFRYSPAFTHKLFFAILDFDDGSDVFRMLGLNTAPAFIHFPAKGKRKGEDRYDVQRQSFQADKMAKWVADRTGVSFQIFRPPNYVGTILAALFFILAGTLLYVQRNSLHFFYNKNLWGLIALVIVFLMTSGQMWNHIRGPPYFHKDHRTGNIGYVAGRTQFQFVAESHIVILVHMTIVLGFVLLDQAGNKEVDIKKRRALAIIGLAFVVAFFSILVSIFRMKSPGYPYRLLF